MLLKSRLFYYLIVPLYFILCPLNLSALGWDTLSPTENDDKYFLHGEGFLTYTDSTWLGDNHLFRHSYFWVHLTGGYEVINNFWLSSWLSVYKYSFSYDYNYDPFHIHLMPQLSYNNLHDVTDSADSQYVRFNINLGSITNFTHGHGLFYSQFIGTGAHVYMAYRNTSMELTTLGYGYDSSNDLGSFYFYPYKKYFGIGLLAEINGFLASRIVPGINFEFNLFNKILRFYGEAGLSYVYDYNPNKINLLYVYLPTLTIPKQWAMTSVKFSPGFSANRSSLAAMAGIDLNLSAPDFLNLKFSLVNQFRYYGVEHSNFYYVQSVYIHGFDYYYDISIDRLYNNQPHNFYIYPGEKWGMYFRQELEINPFGVLYLKARNELLWIYTTYTENGKQVTSPYGNDILGADILLRFKDHVEVGTRISNVFISVIESFPNFKSGYKPEGLFLQATNGWLLDFYCHVYF